MLFKTMDNRPIGVFDSGLGGLTVVKELVRLMPHEYVIYLGDTARVPYGTRSTETITKFAFEDVNFLLTKNVKCIIIACNTVSAVAGKLMKSKVNVPVFDVISSVLAEVKSKNVAVIGTRATITSGAYKTKYALSCPLLVPFIEEGDITSEALKLVTKEYLRPLKNKKIQTLILGCTHYPIIEKLIQHEVGKDVQLINPGKSMASKIAKYLTDNNLVTALKASGKLEVYVTDLTERFTQVAKMFLGQTNFPIKCINI